MARVSAVREHETLWSDVFPGNTHTVHALQPAVLATELALELSPQQRRRTVWRIDGGGGSDDLINWLLERDYHLLVKGTSNRRAQALAQKVSRWDAYRADAWAGEVEPTQKYARPVRWLVKRRQIKDGFHYSYYVSTLSYPSKAFFLRFYDDRGAAEVEQFRNDKGGLSLAARRKQSFSGQKGYILLTDVAHNLLANFAYHGLKGSRFEHYGLKRILRDLLAVPGRLIFEDQRLVRVELLSQKQFVQDLMICLVRFCNTGKTD